MALLVHRATLVVYPSTNPPDDPTDWLVNPILPDCESRYWKIVGDDLLEMSAEEKSAVDLPIVRAGKALAVDSWYESALAAGYDTGSGYRLAASLTDQTRFSQDAILQSQSVSRGLVDGGDYLGFLDAAGVPRMMTIDDYLALLCGYGQWCRGLLIQRAGLLGAVAAATAAAEIDAIQLPN